jgi:hypothetical protein
MSRRDKPRHNDTFQPRNHGTARTGAENKDLDEPKKTPSVNVHGYDPDEDEGEDSYFYKVGAAISGFFGKIAAFFQSAALKAWGYCQPTAQWTWNGLRKIPSYCVLRWEDNEDETQQTVEKPKEVPARVAAKTQANPNAEPTKAKSAPANELYDEDEFAPSRWWSIGIKSAAVAAALLVFAGGYFAVKTFTGSVIPAEVAADESDDPDALQGQSMVAQGNALGNDDAQTTSRPVRAREENLALTGQLSEGKNSDVPLIQPQEGDGRRQTADGSVDPFSPTTPIMPPVFAENAPRIANDPFAVTDVAAASPPQTHTEQALSPLQPIDDIAQNLAQNQPQLLPLVPLDSPALAGSAPAAATAQPNVPVATNYAPRQPRTAASPPFNEAPAPPPVTNTIPQSVVQQTVPITEPVREIVPLIPPSGTVQNVPPPVAPVVEENTLPPARVAAKTQAVNTSAPMPSNESYRNESVPAIPKDAPRAAATPVAVQPPMQNEATNSPPIDRQLREQLRELRNETEAHSGQAEPTKLRFGTASAPATSEPALRFESRPAPVTPPAHDGNLLRNETTNSFRGLIPNELSPHSNDIAAMLPALENAPPAAFAEIRPKYRDDASRPANNEGGTTFRNRQLEMQRSAVRYIVQEGDTIFRLATDKLQDSTRWREIYAMNSDRLQDVRDLRPGMEILLPAETARLGRVTH